MGARLAAPQDNDDAEFNLRVYVRYAKRMLGHRWTIILMAILGVVAAAAAHFVQPKTYESSTTVLIQGQAIPEEFIKSTVKTSSEQYITTLSKQVMSRSRLEKIILDMDLYPQQRQSSTMDDVVLHMQKDIEINAGDGSFKITYQGGDPKTVQAVCRRLADIYIQENSDERVRKASDTAEFLQKRMVDSKAKLDMKEDEIKSFREGNLDVIPAQGGTSVMQQALANAYTEKESLMESIRQLRTNKSTLAGSLMTEEISSDPAADARNKLADLRSKLRSAESKYTPQHPDVVRLKGEVSRAEMAVRSSPKPTVTRRPNTQAAAELRAVKNDLADAEKRLKKVEVTITDLEKDRKREPGVTVQLVDLERERRRLETEYEDLRSKFSEAERSELLESKNKGEQFKILDAANLPTRAAGAGLIKLTVAGLFIGLLLGLALAFLRVLLDPRIYEVDDLRKYIDAEVLVEIPHFGRKHLPRPTTKALPPPSENAAA